LVRSELCPYIWTINEQQHAMNATPKITSRRELAIKLSEGAVDSTMVSIRLAATVKMWERRKEVVIANGVIRLA
jgi:hypothetical protein